MLEELGVREKFGRWVVSATSCELPEELDTCTTLKDVFEKIRKVDKKKFNPFWLVMIDFYWGRQSTRDHLEVCTKCRRSDRPAIRHLRLPRLVVVVDRGVHVAQLLVQLPVADVRALAWAVVAGVREPRFESIGRGQGGVSVVGVHPLFC